ncbi:MULTISPECIES: ATP/GTP-binding protein [unclassified Chromobacterium]|uniref:GTP-binding protein n=1 Tax=unclassified Chromobacterium TaxID=2641838 RepID=UPI00065427AE|nr:ATP/GTP-binding protein [Chromobacterium sp. LK1]KMN34913.1 GTP-binding protein [Chromobacterium sp. LK1]
MRSQDNKILFAGPVGAGKTTAIAAISDIAPIRTDAKASDMTLHRKAHTTVALDYGMLRLDADTKVHLYGTPGQERFDFMWEIVSRGGIGLILLLDHSRANPMQDLAFFLRAFEPLLRRAPLALGVSKTDLKPLPSTAVYAEALAAHGLNAPVFEVDCRRREDIKQLLLALLFSIDPGLGEAQ